MSGYRAACYDKHTLVSCYYHSGKDGGAGDGAGLLDQQGGWEVHHVPDVHHIHYEPVTRMQNQ